MWCSFQGGRHTTDDPQMLAAVFDDIPAELRAEPKKDARFIDACREAFKKAGALLNDLQASRDILTQVDP